jgi:hypothetical protein
MDDLRSGTLADLDWSPEKRAESLDCAFRHAMSLAEDAINWYLRGKQCKKLGAGSVRVLTIVLGTIAALLPTIGELVHSYNEKLNIGAGWTIVLLGIAGCLLLLDRFYGFTSGWMRYIVAELQIRQIKEEFQLDWQTERAGWSTEPPTKEQVVQMLARCKAFTSQVNTIVREETNVWVQEFQTTIKYLDDFIKAKTSVTEPGALNLTIINGEEAEQGWILTIDNGAAELYTGRTVGKRNISPGKHEINVQEKGGTRTARKVVAVPAGGTCEETLTLN